VAGCDSAGRGQHVRARLVVGADGVHSVVVRALGLRKPVRWPRRLGLVTHLRGVLWPEDHGQMHVGPRGYVGVAPLGQDLVTVGLVMPMPGGRLGAPDTALEAALAAVGQRACGVQGVGPLAHAVRSCGGHGYLLVGDAAGFFDPFTGEGIYRALRGAEIAAQAADRALRAGAEVVSVVREYDRARRAAFRAKERLTALIQVFVQAPSLMNYAVERLSRRPRHAARLGNVLGDLEPAGSALRPGSLWALLRP
jgi:flavin-dependent dehydrogenase